MSSPYLKELLAAVSAPDALRAIARAVWAEDHDGDGDSCPEKMIPKVADFMAFFSGLVANKPVWSETTKAYNERMAECVAAVGVDWWRAHSRRMQEQDDALRAKLGISERESLAVPPEHGDEWGGRWMVLSPHLVWVEAIRVEPDKGIKHPLGEIVRAWQSRGADSRHVIAPASMAERGGFEPRPLVRAPAVASFLGRPLLTLEASELEAIEVDGEPLASRWADGEPRAGYRIETKPVQGELLPVPLSIGKERIEDFLISTLAEARLTGDERAMVRNDVHKLALAAYALTGNLTIPDEAGARFIGGRSTPANLRRWRTAVTTARGIVLVIDKGTMEVRDLLAASFHNGGVDLGPPSWWVKDGSAWRLSGGLWRPSILGDSGDRGPEAGYGGGLHRTVSGLEAALTWGTTAGRGRHGRIPDNLRPASRGGPGPEVFVPWWNVLRLSGEPVTVDTPFRGEGSGGAGKRFQDRVTALLDAGYGYEAGSREPARAGDTIEIRRVLGGRGRTAGVTLRASARFIEAYRLGQKRDNWERLPASRLFGPRGFDADENPVAQTRKPRGPNPETPWP